MSTWIKYMNLGTDVSELQDKGAIDSSYKYWRIRILYSTFIGYAFYYFTRKSLNVAMTGLSLDLGFAKTQLGILASIFAITYGISKFASGMLGDKVSPRYMMSFGLIITGFCNIFFGMSSSLLFFAIFWGLNAWFQGFGWPPCARFLTHWYSNSERGSWWSIWNVSHNVGGFLIAWIAGICLHFLGWRYAMYIPGVLCIMVGVFLFERLRDTPQSLGLPSIEKFRNDYGGIRSNPKGEALSAKEILWNYVLKNKCIWLLAISYFFVYTVRSGVEGWTAFYLIETKGYNRMAANGFTSFFEVGGFFGSLVAGWSSDRLFGAKRGPVNVIFALGMLFAVCFFWMVPYGHSLLDSMAIFLLGFTIFGPQMLIGMAAAELSHKNAVATATGFTGTFAYMGSMCAGLPLSKVIQDLGWEGFHWTLIVCCCLAIVLLIPLWGVTANTLNQYRQEPSLKKEEGEALISS